MSSMDSEVETIGELTNEELVEAISTKHSATAQEWEDDDDQPH